MASRVGGSRRSVLTGDGEESAVPRFARSKRGKKAQAFTLALGATIRAIRREQRLHQDQLGARVGFPGSRIGEIERGVVSTSVVRVAAIAAALGMTMATLIARVERSMAGGRRGAAMLATIVCGARQLSLDDLDLIAGVISGLRRAT